MSESYQFGIHVLFIVAIVQFMLGAASVWLFSGAPKIDVPIIADAQELETIREKQRGDQKSIEDAMKQMYRLTGRIGHDVGEHSARVKQINDEIADATARGGEDVQATLMAAISKITEANEKLQSDLRTAEAKMAEQAAALESQMEMARTDALTGVLNRRAFDDEILRRVSEFQRYRTPVSLLLFDIDHFKKFNDTYGHQTGDDVLVHVACTLQMVMRDVDLVCRYGGEEFAIILPATDLNGAALAAERARAAVERMTVDSAGQLLNVTASCGAASAMPNEDVAGLIARADQGLYASKKAGRNCVHIHDGQLLIKHGAGGTSTVAESKPMSDSSPDKVPNEPAVADPLITLPNRDAFSEEVRRRLEQHQKYQAPVTIVYGGVDGFTGMVAEYGRETCNVILRAVAQFIKSSLHDSEMLARVADDRFAMVLGGIDAPEAMIRIERILNSIRKCRLPIDGLAETGFTASFGLAEVESGNDTETLMNRGAAAYVSAAAKGDCAHIEISSKVRRGEAVGV